MRKVERRKQVGDKVEEAVKRKLIEVQGQE